jgi:TonB family protein
MGRRNPILTFALCASMTAHTGLLMAAVWWYIQHTPLPNLAALPKPEEEEPAPILADPPPTNPQPKPLPPPPPPPPPPDDFTNATKEPLRDDSGETKGVGTANRSSPGDKPMQARQGYEQANLARNAKPHEDDLSQLNDVPAQAGSPLGGDSPPAQTAFGVPQPSPVPAVSVGQPKQIAIADPTQAAVPQPVGDSNQQSGTTGSPDAPRDAKDPTPTNATPPKQIKGISSVTSDTDSMPFAKANSVTFHNGKVEGRKGRIVKTTRIDFGLAGEADLFSYGDPRVVLGVRVDAGGDVQSVVVLRSSGSDNIDRPAVRSVYNWWFEPLKDKDGNPLADLWVVTIE